VGKRAFSLVFLDPSSPRLASGLPSLASGSPGRAAFAPSAHFPINRHAREAEKRLQGSEVERIERREK